MVEKNDIIQVPILTRVEGEGRVVVQLRDGAIEQVKLNIYEPPRLFEALLKGRPLENVPDITARICGICPVAYQMSSVHALEVALGISLTPEIRRLRRLLYCGEWIESHALHIHLLHAPDFFGAASGIELAQRFPNEVRRGMQLKKYGNRLLEVLGGRAIHPINVTIGGFYHLPSRDEMSTLIPLFEEGLNAAVDTVRWVSAFEFPDFEQQYDFVALTHPNEYPMNEGDIGCTDGTRISVREFNQYFSEEQVEHSTALQSVRTNGRSAYFLGPLARISLNRERLSPTAKRLADEVQFPAICRNPFKGIIARSLEVVHAYEEALEILRDYRPSTQHRPAYVNKAGYGCAATEAPRGTLFHEYHVNDDGTVESGRIVPPTSQNQKQIETDIREYLGQRLQSSRRELELDCERLVRSYDPCISCSTHFLNVVWEDHK